MNVIFAIAGVVIKELYRRKDFYVLFILTALLSLLMASANMFNDDKIVGYLKEIGLLLIWISALVMAVGTAARQIPAERENRTIFPLLAKPVTRGQVIAGKFLGTWLACGLALVVFYLFLAVLCGSRERQWWPQEYLQALWMQWMFLAVVIGIVIWGSIIFAAPSSNATICIVLVLGIMILGRYLNKLAAGQPEPMRTILSLLYYTIPHLEWFDLRDIFTFHKLAPWWACGAASCYAAAYTCVFLFGGWLSFRRKTLST